MGLNDSLLKAADLFIAAISGGRLSVSTRYTAQDDAAFTPATDYVAVIGAQADETATDSVDEGDAGALRMTLRRALRIANDELFPGEDSANGVLKVEGQFTGVQCTGDTQVKASAGFLHSVTFQSTDAAPTAGTIIIYDNTAESGTIICSFDVTTTKFNPFTLIFDRICTTGIYVGFTTTNDVSVQVTYR